MGTGPSADSEITWLLHRAAQRMRTVTGEQAEKHGLRLRDYIVLSALDKTPNLTQAELGKALGLDYRTPLPAARPIAALTRTASVLPV